MRQKLDFPVIGNPENSLMEAEWFFDTNFHLNQPGKEVNTVQLIRDMKAMLGDDRAVTVELPEKPHRTWGDVSAETRICTAKDSETYQGEEIKAMSAVAGKLYIVTEKTRDDLLNLHIF